MHFNQRRCMLSPTQKSLRMLDFYTIEITSGKHQKLREFQKWWALLYSSIEFIMPLLSEVKI